MAALAPRAVGIALGLGLLNTRKKHSEKLTAIPYYFYPDRASQRVTPVLIIPIRSNYEYVTTRNYCTHRQLEAPSCVLTCSFLDFWPAPEAHKPFHIDGMAATAEPPAMEWRKSKGKMKDASLI